ncbi:hypothetical protein OG563_35690 [Nocardia vinacea]|uniref:Luciferase-like domain-containing protein n=1 Tax=Nocardia vinacea TaxID=96468 RepID=A0ABZ1YNB8_9NOCA|nr:hypothetical protein [Nocardia vinacea]
MTNSKPPQRYPIVGPPVAYSGATADVVERFADAVREWAGHPGSAERRGIESTAAANREAV